MTSWRMQLHPHGSDEAARHASESLSAGFIGLDFKEDVGDLLRADFGDLPLQKRNRWAFAHEMANDDHVLIFVHHYPFALAKVSGSYNYVREAIPEIGIWFRHFRRVTDVRYYSDFMTNASAWKRSTMTATLTPLRKKESRSQKLIDEWLGSPS